VRQNIEKNLSEGSAYCVKCGVRFIKDTPQRIYCTSPKCQEYQPIGTKVIKCVDCGKKFEVDARNMTKVKCDPCYEMHRKKYKAEKEKERRRLKTWTVVFESQSQSNP